jgi:hypothetical protein
MIKLNNLPYCMRCKKTVTKVIVGIAPATTLLTCDVYCHGSIYTITVTKNQILSGADLSVIVQIEYNRFSASGPLRPILRIGAAIKSDDDEEEEVRRIDLEEK